jgi:hypothetical protein
MEALQCSQTGFGVVKVKVNVNVKVKVSLCFLTKHHAMKAYWGSGCIVYFLHVG